MRKKLDFQKRVNAKLTLNDGFKQFITICFLYNENVANINEKV